MIQPDETKLKLRMTVATLIVVIVSQFLAMQKCFTDHPEVYGEYLSAFEG